MQANKAAIKAMLVNRVGDVGLVVGIILLVKKYGTLDFAIINGLCIHNLTVRIGKFIHYL